MNDLIEKLERAEAPSRGLLEEAATVFWGRDRVPSGIDPDSWVKRWVRFNRMLYVGAWESAALMLVPEGCLFVLKTLWDADKTAGYAIIQHYAPTSTGGKRYDGETTGLAATPALALCIAALKAKEADNG